ncbi:hypothetical protein K7X08_003257 [Anisodus acutangulus]|uniref:Glycosyltransferase n=1 Tax=Anisodus acutangulus TaxID=402998 RepID=A0A9Q1MDB1_9SOLA|nr:hypothetical protein K7X08_003257 [Anisodus acutangulus]
MDHQQEEAGIPHVLTFPLPIQGPINSMLQLAELFCLAGLKVTFLNTIHNQERLLRCTNVQSRFEQYHGLFRPSCLWVYLCLPKLIEAQELPFKGDDLDALVRNIPTMEGLLRRRDLPHFCVTDYKTDPSSLAALKEIERIPQAYGLILNTFEDLDGLFLSCIRSYSAKTYAIGPVHLHLKTRLAAKQTPSLLSSNSLWEEDQSSIKWLDAQPVGSVIYVSFGSLIVASKEEILEFWHGLLNSEVKYLWVLRPNILREGKTDYKFMKDLAEGCQKNGYIVSWAPQKKILAHPAIGGFLTHSGWNSTMESIVEGKPMICWPHNVDQRVNSRLVNKLWKIGLDMKDTCDRSIIERMIKDLMGTKRDEFKKSTDNLSKLAKLSIGEGGSSTYDLESLIKDIKGFTLLKRM